MLGVLKGFTVAIIIASGFQQNEMTSPKKALEDAGATVHLVALEKDTVQGWDWYVPKPMDIFKVDVQIDAAQADNYDALMIPGGLTNNDDLRLSPAAIAFVRGFANKPIASICHGQWLLIDAQLAHGKTMTSWPSIKQDLINAGAQWVDKDVVIDGNLVTSRMPEDLPVFNDAMITLFAKAHGKHR